jgi:hypothetical protein
LPDLDFYWHQLGNDRPAIGPIGPITIQGGTDPLKTEALVKGDPLHPVTTLLLGDQTKPITTLILGDPNKPVTTLVEGDPNKPVTTLILGDPNKPVTTLVEGDPNKPVTTLILGDPNKPITLSIKDIPPIQLSTDVGIKPTRIHNPLHFTFCISLFGFEVATFAICGEGMTIIEPYHPHKTEACA